MAGSIGNTNNLIWTIEKSNDFFDEILDYVKTNKKCRSLSEACVEVGEYEELISYIQNKYPKIEFKSIKKAKDIVKNRLVNQGLDGDANATMAIFILKNNHSFTDKQQIESNNINTNRIVKWHVDDSDIDYTEEML